MGLRRCRCRCRLLPSIRGIFFFFVLLVLSVGDDGTRLFVDATEGGFLGKEAEFGKNQRWNWIGRWISVKIGQRFWMGQMI